MATRPTCGPPKGRRKQAKPQRKVELDDLNHRDQSNPSETPPPLQQEPPSTSMSPDTNHNELSDNSNEFHKRLNGIHRQAAVPPEEVLNGLSMHSPPKLLKTGGTAEDSPNDLLISVKAAVGEQQIDDDEKIQEYLQRSDTAVIYPEPVGHSESGPGEFEMHQDSIIETTMI